MTSNPLVGNSRGARFGSAGELLQTVDAANKRLVGCLDKKRNGCLNEEERCSRLANMVAGEVELFPRQRSNFREQHGSA